VKGAREERNRFHSCGYSLEGTCHKSEAILMGNRCELTSICAIIQSVIVHRPFFLGQKLNSFNQEQGQYDLWKSGMNQKGC